MKLDKFTFDSEKRKVELNDVPLKSVSEITLHCLGGEKPRLEIKQDTEANICGTLITGEIKTLQCECGYYVGKFIDYCGDVRCPSCGNLIKD